MASRQGSRHYTRTSHLRGGDLWVVRRHPQQRGGLQRPREREVVRRVVANRAVGVQGRAHAAHGPFALDLGGHPVRALDLRAHGDAPLCVDRQRGADLVQIAHCHRLLQLRTGGGWVGGWVRDQGEGRAVGRVSVDTINASRGRGRPCTCMQASRRRSWAAARRAWRARASASMPAEAPSAAARAIASSRAWQVAVEPPADAAFAGDCTRISSKARCGATSRGVEVPGCVAVQVGKGGRTDGGRAGGLWGLLRQQLHDLHAGQ